MGRFFDWLLGRGKGKKPKPEPIPAPEPIPEPTPEPVPIPVPEPEPVPTPVPVAVYDVVVIGPTEVYVGESVRVLATVHDALGNSLPYPVTWTVSPELTISGTLVTAVAEGAAWVEATCEGAMGFLHVAARKRVAAPSAQSGIPTAPATWTVPVPNQTGTVHTVTTLAELNTAITNSVYGDSIRMSSAITIQASDNIVFDATGKTGFTPGSSWIVVETTGFNAAHPWTDSALRTASERARPSWAGDMACIQSDNAQGPIRVLGNGWYFRGIEVTENHTGYQNYGLFRVGPDNPTSLSDCPDYVVLDRCYVHNDATNATDNCSRAVQMHARHWAVINSYLYNRSWDVETQGIGGWACPGPGQLRNNTIMGTGENLIWGGADAGLESLVPQDVEIDYCYFFKPPSWYVAPPGTQITNVKNTFELKAVKRLRATNCLFEGCWADAQNGSMMLIWSAPSGDSRPYWEVVAGEYTGTDLWPTYTGYSGGGKNWNPAWVGHFGTTPYIGFNYTSDVEIHTCKFTKTDSLWNLSQSGAGSGGAIPDFPLSRVYVHDCYATDVYDSYNDSDGRVFQLSGEVTNITFRKFTADTILASKGMVVETNVGVNPLHNFEISDSIIGCVDYALVLNGATIGQAFAGTTVWGTTGWFPDVPYEVHPPTGATEYASLAAAETGVVNHVVRSVVDTAISGVNVYEAIGTD